MCGIAGIYRRGAEPSAVQREEDRVLVRRMLASIEYRGPDDEGLESLGRVTLGVRRLSILDVPGGHQPLSDASGRVWAAQNGELYDYPRLRRELAARHPLRTSTDTEVLPYLWLEHGPACVEHLRGMFAFAIHDTAAGTLLLARDPLGVKPLYVADVGERVLFASELKALLCDPALPRVLDLDAVGDYLALGWIPGDATPFTAVRKVRPGHRILLSPERAGCAQERYWPLPRFFTRPPGGSLEDLAGEAARLLSASAVSMLLSDRPLGVLLSGGLDSSVLVALLPEDIRRETRTFAIGFEDGGHHDERGHARRVAAHLGTRHRELTVPLDVGAELPRLVRRLDEPLSDPAALPAHLVARAASAEVTVLLSGTGGDEVFGGYHRYRLPGLLRRAGVVPRGLAARLARALGERDQHRRTVTGERLVHLRKLLEARSRGSYLEAYLSAFAPAPPSAWEPALAAPVRPGQVARGIGRRLAEALGRPPASDDETSFAVDHLFYVPDDLLLKEDRMTMAASVEGRVPYLDPPLVEFGASLPPGTRFEGGRGKRLLRRIARDRLPADIVARPKHGFSAPIEDWLRGPLDALQSDVFSGDGSGVFRMEALRRWQAEHRTGRDRSGALWAALSFELWWRMVGAATPSDLAADGRPAEGRA